MKIRYLEPNELEAVKAAASPRNRFMIALAFNHGLRVSETLSLTLANFKDGYLTIQRLKGSEKTVQRLLPDEKEMLANYVVTDPSGRLFPITRQMAWKAMKSIGRKTGTPAHKCTNHSLKHTCAITGLRGGMPINALQTYLGHKSGNSTMAYLRVNDETASDAFAKAVGQ